MERSRSKRSYHYDPDAHSQSPPPRSKPRYDGGGGGHHRRGNHHRRSGDRRGPPLPAPPSAPAPAGAPLLLRTLPLPQGPGRLAPPRCCHHLLPHSLPRHQSRRRHRQVRQHHQGLPAGHRRVDQRPPAGPRR
ncbi:unnamed protein product [Musa textilis]